MQIQTDPKLLDLIRRQTEAMERIAVELRVIRRAMIRRDEGADGPGSTEDAPDRPVKD